MKVALTNLDKVFWPSVGLTKAFVVDWYVRVSHALLPWIDRHPVTLHRFPDGVEGAHWYETRCPPHPDWVRVHRMPFRTGKVVDACVLDDVDALVWAAQAGTIEIHPYLDPVDDPGRPRWVVFDLDPGPEAGGLLGAARLALRVREVLDAIGLASAPKSTGGAGLHVYVPVTGETYERTKAFARSVAALLVREDPGGVTDLMPHRHRTGRVFVDWSQNDAGKSTVAPWSLRGTRWPTVSAPLTWDRVEGVVAAGDPSPLVVRPDEALALLDAGDAFTPLLDVVQSLPDGAG